MKDDPFKDDTFYLTLRLRVPAASGFLDYYRQDSPMIIIDKYFGYPTDLQAPRWLHEGLDVERRFWQRRYFMTEFMLHFVNNLNHWQPKDTEHRVRTWCKNLSVSFPPSI